jgi:hypothetical protein
LFFFAEFELPPQFKTWGEAMKAMVDARIEGLSPDEVHEDVWKVFETVAFLLIPKVNK